MGRDQLIAMFLDYRNNYLSTAHWGEANGLNPVHARALIDLARSVVNSPHPES